MSKWLGILLGTLRSAVGCRRVLALENLALRQQLAVFKQAHPRPRLTDRDRFFWVAASRLRSGRRNALHVVQPDTVIRWHRQGFRYYWRWKSRRRGRPSVDPEIIHLIRRMCRANPLWGAPRIHGELLKLGIEISEVSTAPRSPWQNPYAERVIGSIRRECLDHMIILSVGDLRRILSGYADDYNGRRTHLSLAKDAAEGRLVQSPSRGIVRELERVCGLHHEYVPMAA